MTYRDLIRNLVILFALTLCFCTVSRAAECNGINIDGQDFDATVFSYSTAKYYYVTVEFDGDECIIKFPKGGRIRVSLDDEEIEDCHSISAFYYKTATYWDIDLDDCPCEDES